MWDVRALEQRENLSSTLFFLAVYYNVCVCVVKRISVWARVIDQGCYQADSRLARVRPLPTCPPTHRVVDAMAAWRLRERVSGLETRLGFSLCIKTLP